MRAGVPGPCDSPGYLPSFADGDGDGRGDLPGVRGPLDHLQQLGVDLLWLTPFYLSPQPPSGVRATAGTTRLPPRSGGQWCHLLDELPLLRRQQRAH